MLPAGSRLRRAREFTEVVSRGVRAGRTTLVVHLDVAPPDVVAAAPAAPRAGFVVSKAIGPSVVRHRVVRRLRALVVPRLPGLPRGARLVVRALPAAAGAPSSALAVDLDAALARARSRWEDVGHTDGRPSAGAERR